MTNNLEAKQKVIYPVLETILTIYHDGKLRTFIVDPCCFHDLDSEDDAGLAGMGLSIVGNLVKVLGKNVYDNALDALLMFKRFSKHKGITCPWPGMPDDSPIPLDLMQMPFHTAMFLDDDQLKYRVDRLTMMARIQHDWVPWLRKQMELASA